ncbi:MAG: hypothetical protein VKJ02_10185 [Snowella sp.]|nr:hypothetical protein [Snowella sp.]
MPESLFFLGKMTHPQKNSFAILLSPFAQVKKFFQTLYFFILRIMWSELICEQKQENEWAGILFFFIFLLLSWVTYLGKVYFSWVLAGFLILWYLDYGWAKADYHQGKYSIPIYLLQTDDGQLIRKSHLPNRPPSKLQFDWTTIREIKISQVIIYGGAFQEKLGKVWQISLRQFDEVEWIIDEAKTVPQALYQAKIFQQWVNAPIIFNQSQGLGNYAEFSLDDDRIVSTRQTPLIFQPHRHPEKYAQYQVVKEEIRKNYLKHSGINLQKTPSKWHIFSVWQFQHSWTLLKQIIQESGFLLFLLIMSRLMLGMGEIVDRVIQGFKGHTLVVEISHNWLSGWTLWPVAIAVAIMIYKGWQLSRVKHCFLDPHFLKVMLDNQVLGKLNLKDIEAILLLNNPEPEILIFTLKDAIILPKLQQKEDSKLYLRCLQEGIDYFQNLNQSPQTDL